MESNIDLKFNSIDGCNFDNLSEIGPFTDLLKVGEADKSGINQPVSNVFPNESRVEKVKKTPSSSKQKPSIEESKAEQIKKFLEKYATTQFNDVSVKEMRHIIPLLLMEVYVEKYGHFTKKVKGLWEKRPAEWPDDVPFVDPNNKLKDEGEKNQKPKKELLGKMLGYLVKRYKDKKVTPETFHSDLNLASTMDIADDSNVISLKETSELGADEYASALYSGDDLFSSDYQVLESDPIQDKGTLFMFAEYLDKCSDVGSCSSAILDEPEKPPEQVMDSEDSDSSRKFVDPVAELKQRIQRKLVTLKKEKFLPDSDLNFLEQHFGMIAQATDDYGGPDQAMYTILKRLHKLEESIDYAKMQKKLSQSHEVKLRSLNGKLASKLFQTEKMTSQSVLSDGVSSYTERRVDMTSLNIEPRPPGPASGTPPSVNHLKLRETKLKVTGDCQASTLSENFKPVQLAEEDVQATTQHVMPDLLADEDVVEYLQQVFQGQSGLHTVFSIPVQETSTCQPSAMRREGCATPMPSFPGAVPVNQGLPLIVSQLSSTEAIAEKCINRLSLQSPEPAPVKVNPRPYMNWPEYSQPVRKSAGKRAFPFDGDAATENAMFEPIAPSGSSNVLIPTTVEEMGDVDKPCSRSKKKKVPTATLR